MHPDASLSKSSNITTLNKLSQLHAVHLSLKWDIYNDIFRFTLLFWVTAGIELQALMVKTLRL